MAELERDRVEVTEAMIEAGAVAWSLFDPGDRLDWMLAALYVAMERARRGETFHDLRPQSSPGMFASPLSGHKPPILHSDR